MKEYAQPQTIEAADGFPIDNPKFQGGAQEVMAVIHGNKPVCACHFDSDHIPSRTALRTFTFKHVYSASKKVALCRYEYATNLYYYFRQENIKKAYLLSCLWQGAYVDLFDNNVFNIVVGLLLGYKKQDIRAWFVMELQELFDMDFNDKKQRRAFLGRSDFQKEKQRIVAQFEDDYAVAEARLKTVLEGLQIPTEWKEKITTLVPPKKRIQHHMYRSKLVKPRYIQKPNKWTGSLRS